MRHLGLDPDTIAELIQPTLEDATGGWSMGVQGALAEFAVVGDERPEVRRSGPGGRTVEAITAGGAIRLTITDDTVAYVAGADGPITLAVPRSTLPPEPAGHSGTGRPARPPAGGRGGRPRRPRRRALGGGVLCPHR